MGTGTLPWRRFEGRLKEAGTMGTVPTYLDECGADSACKDHDCNMPSVARAVAATWCDYEKKDDLYKYISLLGDLG